MISTTNTKHTYDGNDITTSFPWTFEGVISSDEIKVYLVEDPDAAEDGVLVDPSLYTVSLTAQTVTYSPSGSPLVTGAQVVISREIDLTQERDLVNGGPYDAEEIEAAFDKLTKGQQQLSARIERTLAAPIYVNGEVGDLGVIITAVNADMTAAAASAAAAAAALATIEDTSIINAIIFGGG